MANRRVYEIARDRGLSTSELIERLERDGIHDKKPLSTIDEELVDAALADTAPAGQAAPRKSAPRDAPPSPPPAHDGDGGGGGPQLGRMELRRRLRQLRRQRDAQLKELGGLAVELRRGGRTRHRGAARQARGGGAGDRGGAAAPRRPPSPPSARRGP